jgi:transcriptional regulator with PAS, ATPase and Fis domain
LLRRHFGRVPAEPPFPAAIHGIIGESSSLRSLCEFAARIAPTNVTVLISGETGTGKDLLATMIHRLSRRVDGPLVALNCAAIPDALLEGELFGYERGAFTGAHNGYPGKLKLADGGTLLLDEIGELSPAGQAKVLRAIETGEAYKLGARTPTHFNVRVIAATNRDMAVEMKAGRFREDLFYRLAVAQIAVPPLRERPEDIAPIARWLLQNLAGLTGKTAMRIGDDAMTRLKAHGWPGNVRELRNVIEIAMVTCDGDCIQAGDLQPYLTGGTSADSIRADERTLLLDTLERTGGNKSEAAKVLHCSRMTLYRRLARQGLAGDS